MTIDPTSPPFSFVRDYLAGQAIAARDIGVTPLAGDGSDRTLYRVSYPGNSVILAVHEHPPSNERGVNENDSFAYVCNHLRSRGFPAPVIHAFQKERGWVVGVGINEFFFFFEVDAVKGGKVFAGIQIIEEFLVKNFIQQFRGKDVLTVQREEYFQHR